MGENPIPEIFEKNLTYLRLRWPEVAEKVCRQEEVTELELVPGRQSGFSLKVNSEAGVETWLHSRYRPEEEALKQIEQLPLDPNDSLLFLSAGLGYSIIAAIQKAPKTVFMVWVEPNLDLFTHALKAVDFTPLFKRDGVELIVGASEEELFYQLDGNVSRLLSGGLKLIPHPASKRAFPKQSEALLKCVNDFTTHGAVSIRSALYLSRISVENQFDNLPDYISSVGLSALAGKFNGVPAVVVAAGPSLEKNVEEIRRAQGKAVIIAVSTAMKVLLGRGIQPDLTAIIDYHNVSGRYFEAVDPSEAAPVVCDSKANAAAIQSYPGVKLFGNDHLMNTLLDGVPGDKENLLMSATVAHAAFDMARTLGCDPIIMTGLDLSYPQGRHHVAGTAQQEQHFNETSRFYTFEMKEVEWYFLHRNRLMEVPAIGGGTTYTSDIFFSYLREFEKLFRETQQQIIDATEGGAKKKFTVEMTLNDALDQFATRELDQTIPDCIRQAEEEVDEVERYVKCHEAVKTRISEINQLSASYKKAIKLLKKVVKSTDSGKAANKEVLEVQKLRERFNEYGFLFHLLNHFAQADLFVRVQKDREITGENLTGVEKQNQQAQRDLDYIRGLDEALRYVKEKLVSVEETLEQRLTELELQV